MANFPQNDDLIDLRVRSLIYDSFMVSGAAPGKGQLAAKLSRPEPEITAVLERLSTEHILVLQRQSREVLMAMPFSAVPTPFRVVSDDRQWWGNCIWDALGILAMQGNDGIVESSCPDCGESLSLQVENNALLPEQAVVHFAIPAARWWDDIVFT